jgi:hypothetical protein
MDSTQENVVWALVSKHEVEARAWQEAKQWTIDLQKELQILSFENNTIHAPKCCNLR